MKPITVDYQALLETLRKNRGNHRAIFEEALEGYRQRAIEILEQHIERIKAGKLERVYVSVPPPEDHTHDYDRVIAMVEWAKEEAIVLDERDFARYVLDDWDWTRQWIATATPYSTSARRLSEERGFDDD